MRLVEGGQALDQVLETSRGAKIEDGIVASRFGWAQAHREFRARSPDNRLEFRPRRRAPAVGFAAGDHQTPAPPRNEVGEELLGFVVEEGLATSSQHDDITEQLL